MPRFIGHCGEYRSRLGRDDRYESVDKRGLAYARLSVYEKNYILGVILSNIAYYFALFAFSAEKI